MKAIVMCGGFAKRLGDVCKDRAKPLLEVGKKPVVEHIVKNLEKCPVDEIIISTNTKFASRFEDWIKNFDNAKPIQIIAENSLDDKEKLGAIGGIHFVIESFRLSDDIIVINGDNMFDFEISDVVDFYSKLRAPVVVVYDIKNKDLAKNLGVVLLDGTRIVDFFEKPKKPKSTLISTGCYIFPKGSLTRFDEYLDEGNNKDAPGFFIRWLHKKEDVHGFIHNGCWFDIGSKESLFAARKCFE